MTSAREMKASETLASSNRLQNFQCQKIIFLYIAFLKRTLSSNNVIQIHAKYPYSGIIYGISKRSPCIKKKKLFPLLILWFDLFGTWYTRWTMNMRFAQWQSNCLELSSLYLSLDRAMHCSLTNWMCKHFDNDLMRI